jgi:hypothetical protein
LAGFRQNPVEASCVARESIIELVGFSKPHGGSSGGPVFNDSGRVFGIASCSYDGAMDFAFVTPIGAIFEVELQDTDIQDGRGSRNVTVAEIANLGRISVR